MPVKRSLESLAREVGGKVIGDGSVAISGLAGIEGAKQGDITFASTERFFHLLKETTASAAIVPQEIADITLPLLIVKNPLLAAAKILAIFTQRPYVAGGVSEMASVSPSAKVSTDATIHPFAFIGDEAEIGPRVIIHPFVSIGPQARIGDDCVIYPHVTIYPRCILGKRVIVHAGTIIGADGFGFVKDGEAHVKIPQVGIVEIEDDVEIGANCCIDRATFGKTIIKKGVKFDNLVQVGHNVQIGEHSIIVAQVGISGSTKIGKNVILAGQVGVVDHVEIGDNVMVGAQSGVYTDVPPNQVVSGSPPLPHRQFLRVVAVWTKLPEMKKELDRVRKQFEALEKKASKVKE
jgi:UDP-3-O-[3-hydroxymyristoyl] glucosamine N-acyltransferase